MLAFQRFLRCSGHHGGIAFGLWHSYATQLCAQHTDTQHFSERRAVSIAGHTCGTEQPTSRGDRENVCLCCPEAAYFWNGRATCISEFRL
jgi:hypothetical protein